MSCQVLITDFQGIYYPGNKISGHVVCTFTSRESIRGVKVRLCGREHTDWVDQESYYDSSEDVTKQRDIYYTGDNKFLSDEIELLGEKTMSPGRYEYPFTFTVPRKLPPTFQGSYGFIKYYIKGIVDIPFAFDYEDEKYFKLRSPVDFNDIRSRLTLEPCTYQDEKTLCCCFCAGEPITLTVHLPKEAFVLGEVAKIKIEVTNLSNENIEKLIVRMKTTLQSETTSPRTSWRYETELLAAENETGVGAHGQRTYEFDLEIPDTASIFNFKRCSLFKQWCELRIEAVLPGYHSNMEIETLLDIGHIPIRDVTPTQHTSHQQSADIPRSSSRPPSPVHAPDQPPPPYPSSQEAPPYPTAPSFAGSSAANAPPEESAPSAPPKSKLAEEEEFLLPDGEGASGRSTEPPPPKYSDAVPPPPGSKKPSAPPEDGNSDFKYSTNHSQRIDRGEDGVTLISSVSYFSYSNKSFPNSKKS